MTTVARIKKEGSLLLTGQSHERASTVNSGLISYYPMDGNIYQSMKTITSSTKVLGYYAAAGASPWYDWFAANANMTNTADITAVTVDTAKGYDLVVVDCYVWGVDSAVMSKLKDFVDAGVSCLATGNDTRTNVFVLDYDSNGHVTHDVEIDYNLTGLKKKKYASIGSGDLFGGITSLSSGCVPYYRRTDTGTITGFFYVSPTSNAVLYFDEEGSLSQNQELVMSAFVYAYNKSSGGVVNTDNIMGYDGISVESGVTNLLNDPVYLGSTYWAARENVVVTSNQIDPYGTRNAIRVHPTSGTDNYFGSRNTGALTNGTTYTATIWLKATKPATVPIKIGNNETAMTANLTVSWQKFTVTYSLSGGDSNYFHVGGWGSWTDTSFDIFISYPQLEARQFATDFISGSKPQGYLTIPARGKIKTNGSISLDFIMHQYTASYTHLIDNNAYNGKWFFVGFLQGSNYMYTHEPNAGNSVTSTSSPSLGTWHNVVVSWDDTQQYLYLDGVLLCQLASTGASHVNNVPFLRILYPYNAAEYGRVKNLAIYDRKLSDQEVKLISQEGFKVDASYVTAKCIAETPVFPGDSYYFPLSSNTSNDAQLISPSESSYVAYDMGGVWLGTSVTNLAMDSGAIDWNFNGLDITVTTSTVIANSVYRLTTVSTPSAGYIRMYFPLSKLTNGATYTLSYKYRIISGSTFNVSDWCDTSVTTTDYNMGTHHIVSATGTRSSYDATYRFMDFYVTSDTVVEIWDVQLEQKIFPSAYTANSRSLSSLEYNLYSSVGLSWSGSWSICYWKRPVATHTDNMVGYNIDSLGCNGNTVGGSYIWWGKSYDNNVVYAASPGGFSPSEYFNRWQFISLVKSGNTLTIRTYLDSGAIHTRVEDATGISSNAYVTQFGYDLKLGGWDDYNASNSYYRDLVVAKRALTDAELTNLYKQFSIYKTKVYTKNIIEEGI